MAGREYVKNIHARTGANIAVTSLSAMVTIAKKVKIMIP
jgi:hypothetical protein